MALYSGLYSCYCVRGNSHTEPPVFPHSTPQRWVLQDQDSTSRASRAYSVSTDYSCIQWADNHLRRSIPNALLNFPVNTLLPLLFCWHHPVRFTAILPVFGVTLKPLPSHTYIPCLVQPRFLPTCNRTHSYCNCILKCSGTLKECRKVDARGMKQIIRKERMIER